MWCHWSGDDQVVPLVCTANTCSSCAAAIGIPEDVQVASLAGTFMLRCSTEPCLALLDPGSTNPVGCEGQLYAAWWGAPPPCTIHVHTQHVTAASTQSGTTGLSVDVHPYFTCARERSLPGKCNVQRIAMYS
jgi:hypothetical protein